jgi:hypothetical protein
MCRIQNIIRGQSMNQYKVTLKRVEEFYQTILIEAPTQDKARQKADQLSSDGEIEFDYLKESDILEEYIVDIETL